MALILNNFFILLHFISKDWLDFLINLKCHNFLFIGNSQKHFVRKLFLRLKCVAGVNGVIWPQVNLLLIEFKLRYSAL